MRDGAFRDSECYSTSSVLVDDGVMDPRDTCEVLGMCLGVVEIPDVRQVESHRLLARI